MSKLSSKTVQKFLVELASDASTPGGGSAAALCGALAASLNLMVARINSKRLKSAREKKIVSRLSSALKKLSTKMMRLIDEDARVYSKVSAQYAAYFKAKKKGRKKTAQVFLDRALVDAFQVQASLALLSVMTLRVNLELNTVCSGAVKNDLVVSRHLIRASFEGALATCDINRQCVKDEKEKRMLGEEMKRLKREYVKEKKQ